jgi:hypothetical protein
MTPIDEVIATYFRAWNAPTQDGCARLLGESCEAKVAYFDPRYTCNGIDELAARIQRSRAEAPSFRVDVNSAIDGYDDTFRYTWVFVFEPAQLRIPGLDVVVRGKGGRLATLTSFFGAIETRELPVAPRTQARWAP